MMCRGSVVEAVSTIKPVTLINNLKIINSLKMWYLQYDVSKVC